MDEMEKYFEEKMYSILQMIGEPPYEYDQNVIDFLKQIFLAGRKKQGEADRGAVNKIFKELAGWEGPSKDETLAALKSVQPKEV